MHRVRHTPEMISAVVRVCTIAYGTIRAVPSMATQEVSAELPDIPADVLDDAIACLDGAGLLRRRADGRLWLNPIGKKAYDEGCAAELVFGEAFIIERYSPAALHLIVRTRAGDERGGTGFVIDEPERAIVTAKHVLENNQLLRAVKRDGTVLECGAAQVLLGPEGIDLAAIRTELPAGIETMRIEPRDRGAIDLEPIIVLGYPPIAGHEPALIPVTAQATGGVPTYGGVRSSIVLQRMTTPGFSGAPVLDRRGMVIGVIREEGGLDRGGGTQAVFVLGTPAHYLLDIFEG